MVVVVVVVVVVECSLLIRGSIQAEMMKEKLDKSNATSMSNDALMMREGVQAYLKLRLHSESIIAKVVS